MACESWPRPNLAVGEMKVQAYTSPGVWQALSRKFTISALIRPVLLMFISSRFLSVASRCSDPLGRCRRVQIVGYAHLPGSETLAQVKATGPPPVPAVPIAGLLEKRLSPRLGCPRRSMSASHLTELGSNKINNRSTGRTGKRGREPTAGLSTTGAWKSLVRYGSARERLLCYMASFSL